jgi:malonate-semialdehyde dehydrogenase (acetylating)/methylmalonate-semialdehyde dehydrogenase
LFRFRELLAARRRELAEIITSEHGKPISDAVGEIERGLKAVELACGFPHLATSRFAANFYSGVDAYTIKQPLGVVAIFSPFNFPATVPLWFCPVAIAAGNTVVLKPSEKDPSAAVWMGERWKEAGLPDGVYNVLQGDRLAVRGLLDSPVVHSVCFVGAARIAKQIYFSAARRGKRVQTFGRAKNHMLVLPDADLSVVADYAVQSAFGVAGARRLAPSLILAVEPGADDLRDAIRSRMAKLRVGAGNTDPDVGPLVSAEHRDLAHQYIDTAEHDGADVVVDGRELTVDGAPDGFWLGPTLIDKVSVTSGAYAAEVLSPVLSMVRVRSSREGVDLINSGQFGDSSAIFTQDSDAVRRFQDDIQVGMVSINVPISVPVAYHAFGGWPGLLFGSAGADGAQGFDFFTREKVVTWRRWGPAAEAGARIVLSGDC